MVFTLTTAFGVGYLCKKVFKINWKLASLLSISTAICGGTALASLGPTIKAKHRDIAYAISATFIFDLFTVIAFPWTGQLLNMTDTSYGLLIGTAVNDTHSTTYIISPFPSFPNSRVFDPIFPNIPTSPMIPRHFDISLTSLDGFRGKTLKIPLNILNC